MVPAAVRVELTRRVWGGLGPLDAARTMQGKLISMLTIVSLLLLPAVFCMSIFRVFQLPQTFLSGGLKLNPFKPRIAALGLGAMYCALTVYTAFVLYTAGRTIWNPPKTLEQLFSVAAVGIAYPFLWLVFECVLFHSIARSARKGF